MNTTRKGNAFEDKIYSIFRHEWMQRQLGLVPENTKIYRKRKYYSDDKSICVEVDIALEAFFPKQSAPQWKFLIECKSLSRPVVQDDVFAFSAKIDAVGGHRCRGILITERSLQRGALRAAQNAKIAVARFLPEDNLKWEILRALAAAESPNQDLRITNGLLQEEYSHDYLERYFFFDGCFTHSLAELVFLLYRSLDIERSFIPYFLCPIQPPKPQVDKLTDAEIARSCTAILSDAGYRDGPTPIGGIVRCLRESGVLRAIRKESLGRDRRNKEIQGKISFNPTIIEIASHASTNLYAQRFTLAHELGHFFLDHGRYIVHEHFSVADYKGCALSQMCPADIKRMEWQANRFASHLLLPRDNLRREFCRWLVESERHTKHQGRLFVDNQRDNFIAYTELINLLKRKFKVSKRVIEIALQEQGLLIDRRGIWQFTANQKPASLFSP